MFIRLSNFSLIVRVNICAVFDIHIIVVVNVSLDARADVRVSFCGIIIGISRVIFCVSFCVSVVVNVSVSVSVSVSGVIVSVSGVVVGVCDSVGVSVVIFVNVWEKNIVIGYSNSCLVRNKIVCGNS